MKIKATNLTTKITFEYDQIPHNQISDVYAMTSIQAPSYEPEEGKSSAPIDIVCVIDRSGSMSGEKMKLVKSSLEFMVDQMKEEDHLSIVTFDTNVETILNVTKMNKEGKEISRKKIKSIQAGSCTNLSGGLFEGYSIVEERTSDSKVCSILLFTDGLANRGFTKTDEFVNSINKQKEKLKGPCPIFTFGFGSDHDANMLKSISESSNGLYYYVGKEDEIPSCFADCLGGLLSIVAQNIKIQLKTKNGVTIKKSLASYKATFNDEKTICELSIGDIYSEEFRDLVFVLNLPKLNEEIDLSNVLEFTISYFNVIEKSIQKTVLDGMLKRPKKIEGSNKPNVELDKQRNRIETGDALDIATKLADSSKLTEARDVLKSMISKLNESVSGKEEFTKSLILDLNQLLTKLENQTIYQNEGSKWMNNYSHAQKNQRATNAGLFSSTATYENSKKKAMKTNFKK